MTRTKKNVAILSLIMCLVAMVCTASFAFKGERVFAAELPEVHAKEFVVNNFFTQADQNRSIMYIGYTGDEAIGNGISATAPTEAAPAGGWPLFKVTKTDGTIENMWFGGWQESTIYSVFALPLDTSAWQEFTIPAGDYIGVKLVDDIVVKRADDTWVASSYANTDFTVSDSGTDNENNSYVNLTRNGDFNLIPSGWYKFNNQAQTFTAKTADGKTEQIVSNYLQLDDTTIYIKFAENALDKYTELTFTAGMYKLSDNSYRYFESDLTFYSAHLGCWKETVGEINRVAGVAATCTTDGVKEYFTCTACNKNYSDEKCLNLIEDLDAWVLAEGKIPAEGHEGTWVKGKDPTLISGGTLVKKCEKCNAEEIFDIPVLNENDYSYELRTASCDSDGSAEYVYEKDGIEFVYEVTIQKTGHKIEKVEGKASTCSEYGYKDYYQCSVCKKCFEDEAGTELIADVEEWKKNDGKLSELGEHKYGEWTKEKDPTATETGKLKRVCSADENHEDYFELPALNEKDYEYRVVTAADCKTEGSAEYVYEKDGVEFVYEVKTAKTEHNFSEEWTTDENGHWHVCTVCGEKSNEAAHEDKDSDGKCDVCGATVKTSGEEDKPGEDKPSQGDKEEKGGCKSSVSAEIPAVMIAVAAALVLLLVKKGRKE